MIKYDKKWCKKSKLWYFLVLATEEMVLGSISPIKKKQKTEYAPLAQLDRASVYGTEGRAFESPMAHH